MSLVSGIMLHKDEMKTPVENFRSLNTRPVDKYRKVDKSAFYVEILGSNIFKKLSKLDESIHN